MRKIKLIRLTSALILVVAVIVGLTLLPRPDSVRHHLACLAYLRGQAPRIGVSSLSDYFHYRIWLWGNSEGTQSIFRRGDMLEEHEQALIRLGYFERREFTLSQRTLNAQVWSEFRAMVSNSGVADPRWLHFGQPSPSVIQLTACKADMPIFESIVLKLDTTQAK